jgi:tRNA-specific 2-thiouridylase
MKNKALIAMSGGVDSSVAAYLVKQQGYDCTGITMKLFDNEDAKDARNAADSIGIPYYVNNFTDDFKKYVIDHFIEAYKNGLTPNPCIDCNRFIKFDKLLLKTKELTMDYFVTGHYARIEYNQETRRYLQKKAIDETKDQSYFLYTLTQQQLAQILFPLGMLTKTEVREIAKKLGFKNADKHDSQDICFVQNGNYAEFIEKYTRTTYESGNFIDTQGNILGRHKGIIHYTIGQRRGLAISLNKPMYVHSKNIKDNTVTLCEDDGLFGKSLKAVDFNWINSEQKENPIRVKVKIRYNQTEQWSTVTQTSQNSVYIEFDKPQRAIASGQAAVLYDGDTVVGGGTIV